MASTFIQLPPESGGGGGGSVNSVTATGPLFSSGGTDPNLSITKSDATHNGYLSSADWVTFNAKQSAATAVLSVNSVTPTAGNVLLTTANIAENTNLYFTTARARTAAVEDAINNGVTNIAPSENAVFDALATKLDKTSLFFFVGSNGYTTVQSAVNAAELLPQADSTGDPEYQSGIEIFIPAGFFDESVTIRKNVNLTGLGGWATQINQLAIRPFSDTNCPQNITIKNLFLNGLFMTNETSGGGVFNPDMGAWSIRFEDVLALSIPTFENINEAEFQTCKIFDTVTATNCPNSYLLNTFTDGTFTYVIDDTLPNPPTSLQPGFNGLSAYNCNTTEVATQTGLTSTLKSLLVSVQSSFTTLTLGDNTEIYMDGGSYQTLDDSGADFLYFKCNGPYTMGQPTDWTDPVFKVDDALDQLAARVKALE